MKSRKNSKFIIFGICIAVIIFEIFQLNNVTLIFNKTVEIIKLKPVCECSNKYKEYILVEIYYPSLNGILSTTNKKVYSVNLIKELTGLNKHERQYQYRLNDDEVTKMTKTCDLYNILRRGKNQRVISYSIYGTNQKYFQNLEEIIKQIQIKYPNFTSRVYYDKTVPKDIRCRIECKYKNVVDFCNIDQFTTDLNLDKSTVNNYIDMSYIHKMMWRFLPIGDSFVDVFMSRDTDSNLIDREVDSVNVWLNSNTIGHIMRDHLYHDRLILGGMWGMKTSIDRSLSRSIFSMLMNQTICKRFNPNGLSKKEGDQQFLGQHVYKLFAKNSTIHDSYYCGRFNDSQPFPTQRTIKDNVGSYAHLKLNIFKCPIECRPANHKDWEYC